MKNAIIIGCGISGPAMAVFLKRIGIVAAIYEAQSDSRDHLGAFLGLSPNGLNVLKEILPGEIFWEEFTPGKITFHNSKNKFIGEIDNAEQYEKYGAASIQLKRGLVNKTIRNVALGAGIEIKYNKKLTGISQSESKVTAYFEDGTDATADFLIGADGIHSAVRKIVFPEAQQISYTGLLSTGGFTKLNSSEDFYGSIRMTFGEKSFFAYAVSNTGNIWWFNNLAMEREPIKNELSTYEQSRLKEKLLQLHRNDHNIISEIIESAHHIEIYPIYDIPFLDCWHKNRVCLIGDAAHATAPHIGQGASLALEDTLVLAKCIRDLPDLTTAFAKFEELRKYRVQKIIKQARKVGGVKTAPNKFQQFFRDMFLPFFVKFEAKKMDWVYRYKVNWDEEIASE